MNLDPDGRATLRERLQSAFPGTVSAVAVQAARTDEPLAVWCPDTLVEEPAFLIYSITKPFVAALVLMLADEGRLSLDAPISHWCPEVPDASRISLRQLLNHTAGLPDYGPLRAYHHAVRASPSVPWPPARFATETYMKGLRYQPGCGWSYSNPGYMLLKRIVEETTGEAFDAVVHARIARPLGLSRTFVPTSIEALAPLAPAMTEALSPDAAPRDVRHHYHPGWVSHGVVASTPSDVVRFFSALFSGHVVSSRSLAQMTMAVELPPEVIQRPAPGRPPAYGLGLMELDGACGTVWGHNGGGPGYAASAFHTRAGGGVTACALASHEDVSIAERLVFETLQDAC